MNWSQSDDYAIRTLVDLAAHPDARIREIAARTAIPVAHLAKVVQALARAGLVETTRGRAGGTRLARDAGQITLLQVVQAMQGPLSFRRCPRRGNGCPLNPDCALHRMTLELEDAFATKLERVRVADLVRSCNLPELSA